jgi:hypothetical protein
MIEIIPAREADKTIAVEIISIAPIVKEGYTFFLSKR